MSESPKASSKSSCSINCEPCVYTHMEKALDLCCIGCEKPGIGSNEHNPADNECSDNALMCCPCALVLDIICYIPMCFKCYNVNRL